jgi:methylated-DNA-protein-cysteine methyltransferase-like protein
MPDPFQQQIVLWLKLIPRGKVATYGMIAALAGNPRAARQVVRALHSSSSKFRLPWHRVVNTKGRISLPKGQGYEEQMARLKAEGVRFKPNGQIDFDTYLWTGSRRGRSFLKS